jgi:PKD repeat protein
MRKHLLLGAFTVFGMFTASQLFAQETGFRCGTAEKLRKLYEQNPQAEADHAAFLEQFKYLSLEKDDLDTIYRIPIVFHVLHQYGSENITDAQIYNAVEILNEDFRKMNADTSDIVPVFKPIAEDARIEFRLATIDPQGNCTNGIEHIYTNTTQESDDFSKMHQWHRSRYLNVWVVESIGDEGVAGYAYYPTATTGTSFWIDGIIILSDFIGSIGTGSVGNSRALTHEIGHYFGLAHTWGSNNSNNVACGDDGIEDTPMTKGSPTGVCNLNANTCADIDPYWGIDQIDNVQNFMDYSYCSRMYSADQAEYMNTVLEQSTGGRSNLWSAENIVLVGANYETDADKPLCAPMPDFFPSKFMVCQGEDITFNNTTWRAGATSFEWNFADGTPSTSTATNPNVTFNSPGWKTITLTATNAAGTETVTKNSVVYISPDWTEHHGPFQEDFETSTGYFITQDIGNEFSTFQRVNGVGRYSNSSMKLNNFKDVSAAEVYSDDYYYNNRLGNSVDNLISPSYNLTNTSNVTVSFDYAYGTRTTNSSEITEVLRVFSSKNCGETWSLRATIDVEDLLTAGYVNGDFAPSNDNQWKNYSFNYPANSTDTKTRFRIEFTTSDFSSNLYIDNFNVSGVLGIEEEGLSSISIAPNPVAAGSDVKIAVESSTQPVELVLTDINGKTISTFHVEASSAAQTVSIPMNVAKGCYLLNAIQGNSRGTHRVVVF